MSIEQKVIGGVVLALVVAVGAMWWFEYQIHNAEKKFFRRKR